jgi:hypothetical protein
MTPVRFGIDLGSLNIQRGRDHGLPDYNTARIFYTGTVARRFSDISPVDSTAKALRDLYGNVNNVDLWIGVLAEEHLPGKSVGRTLNAMLKAQFEKLRDGDYYFYLNDPYLPDNVRYQIKHTTFSDVIKRNTALTNFTANAFRTDSCHTEEAQRKTVASNFVAAPSKKISTAEPRIFPNPANESINVELGSVNGSSTIKIFSSDGKLVKTMVTEAKQNNVQINVSDLKPGIYLLNLSTGAEMRSFKFVRSAGN